MIPKFLSKDKDAMEVLYSKADKESILEAFKGRLAVEEFTTDLVEFNRYNVLLFREGVGFLLDKSYDWCIVEIEGELLLVPLKKGD